MLGDNTAADKARVSLGSKRKRRHPRDETNSHDVILRVRTILARVRKDHKQIVQK